MAQSAHKLDIPLGDQNHLNYLLYVPTDYDHDTNHTWPLLIFLHGSAERGDDISRVKSGGILPRIIDKQPDFPFVVVSPQCPANTWWPMHTPALGRLLDTVSANYRVDLNRISVTGVSMGGGGAWHLAVTYPDRFASVVPICGAGLWYDEPKDVCALKDIPVWVFHGAKDDVVPLAASEIVVDTLRECGGNVKFTVYPDLTHNSWDRAYAEPELYPWLLAQRRR